jgi:hypothetical protein
VLKSHGQDYLVGNRLSRADIALVELLYHVEELDPGVVDNFPLLKVLYISYLMGTNMLTIRVILMQLPATACLHS